ncbi:MAG: proline dehydrogenase [Glaciecola sp.]|jgi:proline dehydrogenase
MSIASVQRSLLLRAAASPRLRHMAESGRLSSAVAGRFVAGRAVADAVAVTGELVAAGMLVTLDYLGEAVTDPVEARRSADVVLELIQAVHAAGSAASISVKPTQLGLDVSVPLCADLVDEIAAAASLCGQHVTLDMESTAYTQATIDLVLGARANGHRNVGCAVQSYLLRTPGDVETLTADGASLRLCKGAYAEPEELAHQSKQEVSVAYIRCADLLLRSQTFARFATHDHKLVRRIQELARGLNLQVGQYEFQMLHGVRVPMQQELVAAGEQVRIYVPFGDDWYPYLTRRLAERPANLAMFLRALVGRRRR